MADDPSNRPGGGTRSEARAFHRAGSMATPEGLALAMIPRASRGDPSRPTRRVIPQAPREVILPRWLSPAPRGPPGIVLHLPERLGEEGIATERAILEFVGEWHEFGEGPPPGGEVSPDQFERPPPVLDPIE